MIDKAMFLAVALTGWIAACSSTHEMKSQGQTHWLSACSDDSDCGDDLSCACGACVAPCDGAGRCDVSGVETACFAESSQAVRAMCAPSSATALCLEPCDGRCGSGQVCAGGACVAERLASDPPDASSGDTSDAAAPGRSFVLGVANVSDKPFVLETAGCTGRPTWFTLRIDGEPLRLFGGCPCSDADDEGFCPVPPPACGEPEYMTIQPGDDVPVWTWDLAVWPAPDGSCGEKLAIASDSEIEIEVCWLDMEPEDPFGAAPPRTCATRTFVPGSDPGYAFPVGAP